MQACIYAIINKVNGKVYIGQTRNKIARWSKHRKTLERNEHHNQYLQNAYNKYGSDNFEYKILEMFDDIDDDELGGREMYYIKKYDSLNSGYNIDDGRKSISLQGRQNMSESHLGKTSAKRKLDENDVLMICALDEFIGGIERPLSKITGLNRIVFKCINRRQTYSEATSKYDNLSFEVKMGILARAIATYSIDISQLKNTTFQRGVLMCYMKDILHMSYQQIANVFGVDKRSVGRIYNQECLPQAKDQYMKLTKLELARLEIILQTITCQA